MTTIRSEKTPINASAEKVFEKLSNLENLRGMLDKVPADRIPEDKRQMFENLKITPDTLEIPGAPMGNLVFRIAEKKEPEYIRLKGEGIPLAMALILNISPAPDNKSFGKVDFEIDIPLMLKPMVGGQIQKITDEFGRVLAAIPFE